MDTDAYLIARDQIRDRMEIQRLQLFPMKGMQELPSTSFSWWPLAAQILGRTSGWSAIWSSLATAGAGYALSKLVHRYKLSRFIPEAILCRLN